MRANTSQLNKPIFIVGAARSGTTLLQYMLRSHPNISLPTAESHFFIPFYQRRHEFGDLSLKPNLKQLLQQIYTARKSFFDHDFHGIQFDLDTLTEQLHKEQRSTIPQVIAGLFEANARGEGKKRWGDKTPYYVLHLPTVIEMFPNAQIIHLIRDGRDCCLSMLQRKHDLRIFNTYHAAYTWDKYVRAGQQFGNIHPASYHEIRYEDLLNHPEQTTSRLCDFLEEDFDQSVIDFNKSKGLGKTHLLKQPLQKSNQEKWRRNMSKRQLRIFEAKSGDTLLKNGYQRTTQPAKISRLTIIGNELHLRVNYFLNKWLYR